MDGCFTAQDGLNAEVNFLKIPQIPQKSNAVQALTTSHRRITRILTYAISIHCHRASLNSKHRVSQEQTSAIPLSLNTIAFLVFLPVLGGGPGPGTDAPALLALLVCSTGGPPPRPPGLMWSYLKQMQKGGFK